MVLLALTLAATTAVPPAVAADGASESEFVAAINRERAERGLAAVTAHADLQSVARRHSARMAQQQRLHHNPSMGSEVGGYRSVGENVAYGDAVADIHQALMGSATHRSNILSTSFSQIGVGVEWREGTLWVTQVFRDPSGEDAAPAPPPAPPPPASTIPAPPTHTHATDAGDTPSAEPPPEVSAHLRLAFARVVAQDSGDRVGELVGAASSEADTPR